MPFSEFEWALYLYGELSAEGAEELGLEGFDTKVAGAEPEKVFEQISFNSTTGNILDIKYIPKTGTLFVEFHNGPYRYEDVPPYIAAGFEGSPSATAYLNSAIKGVYNYEAG